VTSSMAALQVNGTNGAEDSDPEVETDEEDFVDAKEASADQVARAS
jgi:hypothetical protein